MHRLPPIVGTFLLLLWTASAPAKIITVNTADNAASGAGETNLVQALNLLQDGDTIRFSLPGSGPFYLSTPPLRPDNGYPAITNNNIIIDGYSQPGALANSNPILCSNNARIQIVLDSRAGGGHIEDIQGYSTHEAATLMIKGATNVTLSGLCFLGPGQGNGDEANPTSYAISYALGADFGHVNGCWIGLDLDGQTVSRFFAGVTGFEGPGGRDINGTVIGVEKTAPSPAAARGQFNLILGEYIAINLEGRNYRIAGNFFNVFPDGLTDYNASAPQILQAFLEIGRGADNLVLGTDGDGVNDAEERNIFGGVTVADDGQLLEWYGGGRTNMIIAGNYFGMAVDGVTRFTNSMKLFGGFTSSTTVRVGSDFDGVSDALEGNVIAMNYPFSTCFPNPAAPGPPIFADIEPGARVSLRGNTLIGNNSPWFSYANGNGDFLARFTNSYAPYVVTDHIVPVLSTSTEGRLKGSCALGIAPYTNILIDVYLADDEGWTNGQAFGLGELSCTDPLTGQPAFHGFAQGRTYLGSFIENGPQDLEATPGQFEFELSSLNMPAGARVTVAASYCADPPGTHNGRTQTSAFAMPILWLPAPRLTIAQDGGGNLLFSWPTNSGPFGLQFSPVLVPAVWSPVSPLPAVVAAGTNYQATLPAPFSPTWFRLAR
jgi:hypothetical protein